MITVTFACGHQRSANGSEEELKCQCGESRVANVDAPIPRFRGHVTGPHADYKDLPAIPVSFAKEKDNA